MRTRGMIPIALLLTIAVCTDNRTARIPDRRPARISVGKSDTILVNDTEPLRLAARVLNGNGHVLQVSGLQYALVSGDQIRISRDGHVVCDRSGDAVVRASLGELSTQFQLMCRPVSKLVAGTTVYLVVGDSAQELPIGAFGLDGKPMTSFIGRADRKSVV